MKSEWIINGIHLVVASEDEIINWCNIQNQIHNHYNAEKKDDSVKIYYDVEWKIKIEKKT